MISQVTKPSNLTDIVKMHCQLLNYLAVGIFVAALIYYFSFVTA